MEKLTKLELIKTAVEEWYSDELNEHQALVNIATVLGSSEPSEDCMKWAEERVK